MDPDERVQRTQQQHQSEESNNGRRGSTNNRDSVDNDDTPAHDRAYDRHSNHRRVAANINDSSLYAATGNYRDSATAALSDISAYGARKSETASMNTSRRRNDDESGGGGRSISSSNSSGKRHRDDNNSYNDADNDNQNRHYQNRDEDDDDRRRHVVIKRRNNEDDDEEQQRSSRRTYDDDGQYADDRRKQRRTDDNRRRSSSQDSDHDDRETTADDRQRHYPQHINSSRAPADRQDHRRRDRRPSPATYNDDEDDTFGGDSSEAASRRKQHPTNTVLLQSLPRHVDEHVIRQLLEAEWRQRVHVRVPPPQPQQQQQQQQSGGNVAGVNPNTNNSSLMSQNRGYGFIEFPSTDDAAKWIENHEGVLYIDDTRCSLAFCYAKPTNSYFTHEDRGDRDHHRSSPPVHRLHEEMPSATNLSNLSSNNRGGWICDSCSIYNYAYRINCFRCGKRGAENFITISSENNNNQQQQQQKTAASYTADDDYAESTAVDEQLAIARMLATDESKLVRSNDDTNTLMLRNLKTTSSAESVQKAVQNFINKNINSTKAAAAAGEAPVVPKLIAIKIIDANAVLNDPTVQQERRFIATLKRQRRDGVTVDDSTTSNNLKSDSACYGFVQLQSKEAAQALHRLVAVKSAAVAGGGGLVIDGNRVSVVYAGITLLSMFPKSALNTINSADKKSAAAVVADHDAAVKQQSKDLLANSGAATAHAALLRFQKHQQTVKLINSSTKAGSIDADANSVTGDEDGVYDAATGYYYYKSTGLYFHPATQLFYDPKQQQYLYYDVVNRQYFPYGAAAVATATAGATTEGAAVAAAEGPQHAVKKVDNNNNGAKEAEDARTRAQRVAREMEQWARNQQHPAPSTIPAVTAKSISLSLAAPAAQQHQHSASRVVAAVSTAPIASESKKTYFESPEKETKGNSRQHTDALASDENPLVVDDIDAMLQMSSSVSGSGAGMPRMRYANAAGDAGCYGTRKYMSRKRDQFGVTLPPAEDKATAVSAAAAAERLSDIKPTTAAPTATVAASNDADNTNFADYANYVCKLCERQFKSSDVLDKHIAQSALHKQNLQALNKNMTGKSAAVAAAPPPAPAVALPQQPQQLSQRATAPFAAAGAYRDRAAERRMAQHGTSVDSDELLRDIDYLDDGAARHTAKMRDAYYESISLAAEAKQRAAASAVSAVSSSSKAGQQQRLGSDNVGNAMLKKMGWQEGSGLGRKGHGMVDPLKAKSVSGRQGLGNRQQTDGEDDGPKFAPGDSYSDRMRKVAQYRYRDLE